MNSFYNIHIQQNSPKFSTSVVLLLTFSFELVSLSDQSLSTLFQALSPPMERLNIKIVKSKNENRKKYAEIQLQTAV